MSKRVKVLVVDDSALVRDIIQRGLDLDPEIEVVGTASNPYIARDQIVNLKPDVLTLDVEMPRMDGVAFLRKLMPQYPLPVIMVSALTQRGSQITLEALAAGAIDFVAKPAIDAIQGLPMMMRELQEKVKMAAHIDVSRWKDKNIYRKPEISKVKIDPLLRADNKVIAIGASTGGTEALREILCALPKNIPGIVIVQHMPAGFTEKFAERLDNLAEIDVKEAETGDKVVTGRALIAPGGKQMKLIHSRDEYRVICDTGLPVCGHRPSVEYLFDSVAESVRHNAIGIILTGMGMDGADAMVKMRRAGARTVAQDQATSVVFGMPKEAYFRGGAESLQPLSRIPLVVKQYLKDMK